MFPQECRRQRASLLSLKWRFHGSVYLHKRCVHKINRVEHASLKKFCIILGLVVHMKPLLHYSAHGLCQTMTLIKTIQLHFIKKPLMGWNVILPHTLYICHNKWHVLWQCLKIQLKFIRSSCSFMRSMRLGHWGLRNCLVSSWSGEMMKVKGRESSNSFLFFGSLGRAHFYRKSKLWNACENLNNIQNVSE